MPQLTARQQVTLPSGDLPNVRVCISPLPHYGYASSNPARDIAAKVAMANVAGASDRDSWDLAVFQAHDDVEVTSLQIIEKPRTILTASEDGLAREMFIIHMMQAKTRSQEGSTSSREG